ncbi:MAG TPA: DegV family protein [Anaerolineae bacterium]|nr:DegV family protein [Anaerolineae bacterium]HRT31352.1 DegV family protein [Anaerolineae bacterium]HXK42712.1 DegV family protein [Anaerolineae bacterium]
MVHIFTDSTSDLSPELIARYNINVVPLTVHIADKTFHDDFSVSGKELFAMVDATGQLPTTSAPSVGEFAAAFDRPDEVIYIGISSKLSASVANARLAAETFPAGKVRVIDSLNLSTGAGLLVLRAADLRDQGASAEEIEREVLAAVPKVRTSFVIDTMRYLYMGGRCTALQSLMGGLLQIRPVIYARPDGVLDVKDKIRGSRARTLDAMLRDFQAHRDEVDLRRVFITHAESAEDAAFLSAALAQQAPIQEILITSAGAVISSHCGPNTIGVLYLLK